MTRFALGWQKQPFDPRDQYFMLPVVAPALPPALSLLDGMIPPINQGSLGSCGPNSAVECVGYDQKAQGMLVVPSSRLFVYYNTRLLMGTTNSDSGVDNRSMLKAMNQYGVCSEKTLPYNVPAYRTKPAPVAYTEGAGNRITSYAAVIQSLPQMKGVLAVGRPFIFGFSVFEQIMSDQAQETGVLTMPSPGATPIGGHDVTIYGWDDAKGVFLFRNHWVRADGTPWGDQGNGTIPYGYATSAALASDFWVVNAIPGAPVPPTPPPPTPPVPPAPPKIHTIVTTGGSVMIDGKPV